VLVVTVGQFDAQRRFVLLQVSEELQNGITLD
jgi:hypothetical protein